jgi:CrcB protein
MKTVFIGIAGSLGASSRFLVSSIAVQFGESIFPWGTLFCNLLGSFLICFIAYYFFSQLNKILVRATVIVFLGAFTTFSALCAETLILIQEQHLSLAFFYMVASFFGGLTLAWLGYLFAIFLSRKGESRT